MLMLRPVTPVGSGRGGLEGLGRGGAPVSLRGGPPQSGPGLRGGQGPGPDPAVPVLSRGEESRPGDTRGGQLVSISTGGHVATHSTERSTSQRHC